MRKLLLQSLSFTLLIALALQPLSVSAQIQSIPMHSEVEEPPPLSEPPDDIREQLFVRAEPVKNRVYIPPTIEQIAQTKIQVDDFNCGTVSDVPLAECEALVALYNNTNGAGWLNKTNWLESSLVGSWHGVIATAGRVRQLNLQSNQLTGTIPDQLGNLTSLTFLSMANNQLTGSIPTSLGNLINLTQFGLSYNHLIGSIPTELGNLTKLLGFLLDNNQLTGDIPTSLGNMTLVEYFFLYNNQLTGSIPTQFGNFKKVDQLYLGVNQLSGSIPAQLGTLPLLGYLYLSDNLLSGEIPSTFGTLTNLRVLYLDSNRLSGTIPSELGNLVNLYGLKLNNNRLEGDVPLQFTNLIKLCAPGDVVNPCSAPYELDIGYNKLTVPASLSNVAAFLANKDPDWQLTQAVEETFSSTGGNLTSNDGNIDIEIPVGALTGDTEFLFAPKPLPSQDEGGLTFAGNSFELTAWTGDPPTPLTIFDPPLVLTLHYDEDKLGAIPEDSLKVYYWDSLSTSWKDAATTCEEGAYIRDIATNVLSLPICHLSEFALLGQENFGIFLPLITR